MIQFEQLVHEMEPIIEKLLSKCRIYKNRDEYKQVALIALWKAYVSYDSTKYHFKAYLYNQMRYDIIDALRQNVKKEKRYMPTTDEKITFYIEGRQQIIASYPMVEKVIEQLNEEEKQLLYLVYNEQRTNEELARYYEISVEAIKKRKYRLRMKLKELGKQFL